MPTTGPIAGADRHGTVPAAAPFAPFSMPPTGPFGGAALHGEVPGAAPVAPFHMPPTGTFVGVASHGEVIQAPTIVKPPIMAPPIMAPPVVAPQNSVHLGAQPPASHPMIVQHAWAPPVEQLPVSHPMMAQRALAPPVNQPLVQPAVFVKYKSQWETSCELCLGIIMMALLILLPLWNAFALLQDDVYMYFCPQIVPVGAIVIIGLIILASFLFLFNHIYFKLQRYVPLEAILVIALMVLLMCLWKLLPLALLHSFSYLSGGPPVAIILTCIAVLLSYTMAVLYFHRYGLPQYQHIQNVMMIWGAFVMTLGVFFVMLSVPMMHEANKAHLELFTQCNSAPRTRGLYHTWQALHMLRQERACSTQLSVERCGGYQLTSYSLVLKYMETHYQCSGFCFQPTHTVNGTSLATSLFSRGAFEASCDASAARDMKQFAGAAAEQVFYEGFFLVAIAATLGLIKMCALFKLQGDYDTSDYAHEAVMESYGAING